MINVEETEKKYEALKNYLKELGSVAIAFSSGVDSTLLLKIAHDVLGEKAVAITGSACWFPQRERRESVEFCETEGIRQYFCELNADDIPGFRANPKVRCYICKKEIFGGIIKLADELGIQYVVDGSNMDDTGDFRPGMQALQELGIKSPLKENGLYKEEIRYLLKKLNIPSWEKPSYACLASRFVYGEEITDEKLHMVERAEELLMSLGFVQCRCRIHGTIARIEVLPEQIEKLLQADIREKLNRELKEMGFSYVTLDLQGFRSGSMNEGFVKQQNTAG